MGIFKNAMEADFTFKQKTSFVFWLIFTLTSIYCAGQSICNTFKLHQALSYVLGALVLGLATRCLTLVKEATSEGYVAKRKLKLYLGGIVFIFVWFFILMANTHYIYFGMASDRMRLNELVKVRGNFELIQNKVHNQIDTFTANYRAKIDNEIDNLKAEITNQWNPGHAGKSDSILRRIEILIGSNADLLTHPPTFSDRNGLRIYADEIADKIRRIRDNNLRISNSKEAQIDSFFSKSENQKTMLLVDSATKNFEMMSVLEKINVLRNSYTLFDKAAKLISDISIPLGKNSLKIDISEYRLNNPPPSIDIEEIGTAWKYFFNDLGNARFILSLIFAMVIDIACFMFWYFGVLEENN